MSPLTLAWILDQKERTSEGQQAKCERGMYRRWHYCINVNFPILIITLWLCKMLILENLGEGYMAVLFLCLLLSLQLFQKLKVKKIENGFDRERRIGWKEEM